MRMDYKVDPSGGPVQNIFQTFCSGLDAAGQSFEPMVKATTRSNCEMLALMSRRAQAYMELPARLSQCKTPQDLATENVRFWQTMAKEYAESWQRMMSAWTAVAREAGQRGNGKPDRDYITFPEPEEANQEQRSRGNERRAA
jgi:hypothetical protein